MESRNKQNKGNEEMSIADLLCSAGYLPPRNVHDLQRFERIYSGRKFETEAHVVNADAIFDKVTSGDMSRTRKLRPTTNQSFLRAAYNIKFNSDKCMPEVIYQDLDKKKL